VNNNLLDSYPIELNIIELFLHNRIELQRHLTLNSHVLSDPFVYRNWSYPPILWDWNFPCRGERMPWVRK